MTFFPAPLVCIYWMQYYSATRIMVRRCRENYGFFDRDYCCLQSQRRGGQHGMESQCQWQTTGSISQLHILTAPRYARTQFPKQRSRTGRRRGVADMGYSMVMGTRLDGGRVYLSLWRLLFRQRRRMGCRVQSAEYPHCMAASCASGQGLRSGK